MFFFRDIMLLNFSSMLETACKTQFVVCNRNLKNKESLEEEVKCLKAGLKLRNNYLRVRTPPQAFSACTCTPAPLPAQKNH